MPTSAVPTGASVPASLRPPGRGRRTTFTQRMRRLPRVPWDFSQDKPRATVSDGDLGGAGGL